VKVQYPPPSNSLPPGEGVSYRIPLPRRERVGEGEVSPLSLMKDNATTIKVDNPSVGRIRAVAS
jgi:hypothetical protein